MKRVCKWMAVVSVVVVSPFVAIYLGTRGGSAQARLVTHDPSAPSETVDGALLHMRVVDGPDPAAPNEYLIGHMVGAVMNHPENPRASLGAIRSFHGYRDRFS